MTCVTGALTLYCFALTADHSRLISGQKVPAPSIDQFAKELSNEPDWYSLGTFLGAPTSDLDKIKHEYSGISVTRCLIETYKCLERLEKTPSWNFIAKQLRALNNPALAEQIDTTYIPPSLEPPSESSSSDSEQSGASIPDSVDQTSRAPKMMIPPEISKEYSSLTLKLTKLCLCFKHAFTTSDKNIDDVQHVIDRHRSLKPYLGNEATWEKIFYRLDKECHLLDEPHILSVITDTIPNFHDPELFDQTGEFKKAVDSFKSSAEMSQLIELFKKSKQTNCQIVVQESWDHSILAYFEAEMRKHVGSLIENQSFCSISHHNHDEHVIDSINSSESECRREEPNKQCTEPVQHADD